MLVLQLRAVWRSHAYYSITGGDTLCAYGIWKVQEGHPLYEWPNQEFYQLTPYNAAFYHSYAGVLKVFGASGPAILLSGRYLTVVFTLLGISGNDGCRVGHPLMRLLSTSRLPSLRAP